MSNYCDRTPPQKKKTFFRGGNCVLYQKCIIFWLFLVKKTASCIFDQVENIFRQLFKFTQVHHVLLELKSYLFSKRPHKYNREMTLSFFLFITKLNVSLIICFYPHEKKVRSLTARGPFDSYILLGSWFWVRRLFFYLDGGWSPDFFGSLNLLIII